MLSSLGGSESVAEGLDLDGSDEYGRRKRRISHCGVIVSSLQDLSLLSRTPSTPNTPLELTSTIGEETEIGVDNMAQMDIVNQISSSHASYNAQPSFAHGLQHDGINMSETALNNMANFDVAQFLIAVQQQHQQHQQSNQVVSHAQQQKSPFETRSVSLTSAIHESPKNDAMPQTSSVSFQTSLHALSKNEDDVLENFLISDTSHLTMNEASLSLPHSQAPSAKASSSAMPVTVAKCRQSSYPKIVLSSRDALLPSLLALPNDLTGNAASGSQSLPKTTAMPSDAISSSSSMPSGLDFTPAEPPTTGVLTPEFDTPFMFFDSVASENNMGDSTSLEDRTEGSLDGSGDIGGFLAQHSLFSRAGGMVTAATGDDDISGVIEGQGDDFHYTDSIDELMELMNEPYSSTKFQKNSHLQMHQQQQQYRHHP
jgi:hypothetical protein